MNMQVSKQKSPALETVKYAYWCKKCDTRMGWSTVNRQDDLDDYHVCERCYGNIRQITDVRVSHIEGKTIQFSGNCITKGNCDGKIHLKDSEVATLNRNMRNQYDDPAYKYDG